MCRAPQRQAVQVLQCQEDALDLRGPSHKLPGVMMAACTECHSNISSSSGWLLFKPRPELCQHASVGTRCNNKLQCQVLGLVLPLVGLAEQLRKCVQARQKQSQLLISW